MFQMLWYFIHLNNSFPNFQTAETHHLYKSLLAFCTNILAADLFLLSRIWVNVQGCGCVDGNALLISEVKGD